MSSTASTSPSKEPIGLNRQEVGSVLGMSAVFILVADRDAKYLYLSDSIEDVLGYEPTELLGRSAYSVFHPDEIPMVLDIHRRALVAEETACVTYMQLKHKSGEWVRCAVEHSTVLDRSVGVLTRAENGLLTILNEITPLGDGKYTIRKWSTKPRDVPSRSPSPTPEYEIDPDLPWPKPPAPAKRTAFLIDRFTDTSRVMYETNDVIVSPRGPFYSIVKPSDRALVRRHIDAVKNWSPIVRTERRSGGVGYAEFHVLKIPDLPPDGETHPQGTDESERHMPGQEFILVEGIFTGCSDALVCIINRIDRRKGKRDRRNELIPASQTRRGSASTVASSGTSGSDHEPRAMPTAQVSPSSPPLLQRIARMRHREMSEELRSDGEDEETPTAESRGLFGNRAERSPKYQRTPDGDDGAEQLQRMHVSQMTRSPSGASVAASSPLPRSESATKLEEVLQPDEPIAKAPPSEVKVPGVESTEEKTSSVAA